MTGALITQDGQLEFRSLLMCGDNNIGFRFVQGLDELPEVRIFDRERAFGAGRFRGKDQLDMRRVVVELNCVGSNDAELQAAVDAVVDATVNTGEVEHPLIWQLPEMDVKQKQIFCRVRKRSGFTVDVNYKFHIATCQIEFEATDPLIYDAVQQSTSTGLTNITSGLSFPLQFPLDFGGSGQASAVTATNAGNTDAPFTVRFDGPADVVSVRNTTTDQEIEVATPILMGQFLEINTKEASVLINGAASRYAGVTAGSDKPQEVQLAPGDNQLVFSATTTGSPTMTVTWRSAWE